LSERDGQLGGIWEAKGGGRGVADLVKGQTKTKDEKRLKISVGRGPWKSNPSQLGGGGVFQANQERGMPKQRVTLKSRKDNVGSTLKRGSGWKEGKEGPQGGKPMKKES